MPGWLKWTLGVAGVPAIAVAPYLWWWGPGLLWVVCPLLCVWAVWLVFEYLRWARTLRQR